MENDLKQISGLTSYGGKGYFKGEINIDSKKFNELPEEIRRKIGYNAEDFLQSLQEKISMEWVKINEADKRQKHVEELTEIFKNAGFETVYVEEIDSEYCKESCCYRFPWIIVTTEKGRIKLGWRKRVMNLDWSDSDIEGKAGDFFPQEDCTKGDKYIHCWGVEKALEYLKVLYKE